MKNILAICGTIDGQLDESAWELLTAARNLQGSDDGRCAAVIIGQGTGPSANELARGFDDVFAFDDERLATPDGEADGLALIDLIQREGFDLVLAPHDNRTIDLLPWLSVKVQAPLLTDCFALEWRDGQVVGQRALHGGKVHAKVATSGDAKTRMASLRSGAFPAASLPEGHAGTIHQQTLPEGFAPRRKPLRTIDAEAGEVDITASDILIAVGRGFEDEDNLELANTLAEAAGGVVCCSRPVVDKGWLPKSRQVGTSGKSVGPKLYVAIGISGSFQHIGGIKGSPLVVAINKDAAAPIFGAADIGIVGDLLEVVPALEDAIRKVKG